MLLLAVRHESGGITLAAARRPARLAPLSQPYIGAYGSRGTNVNGLNATNIPSVANSTTVNTTRWTKRGANRNRIHLGIDLISCVALIAAMIKNGTTSAIYW